MLNKALELNPADALAWVRMADLARGEDEESEAARTRLEQAVEGESAPAGAKFLVGTLQAEHGEYEQALAELQKVCQADSNNAVAWNNQAWVLSQIGADLQEALRCANRALELIPSEPRFLETRGQVYLMLEMWQEAIADLAAAEEQFVDSAAFHEALARACGESRSVANPPGPSPRASSGVL